ncbi:MAG: YdbH domain-containing protein [Victivallales bacterium]|nr:YdbH domain-containing protein [Victivallales bacterium]
MVSSTKDKRRKLFFRVFYALVLVFVPLFLIWHLVVSAPRMLEVGTRIVSRAFGVSDLSMEVVGLSLDEICVRNIRVGPKDNPGVFARELQIVRSGASSGWNKIVVSGLSIDVVESRGRYYIPGVALPRGDFDVGADKAVKPEPFVGRLRISEGFLKAIAPGARVELRDSLLVFRRFTEDVEFRVELPFDLDFSISCDGFFCLSASGAGKRFSRVPFVPQGLSCEELRFDISSEGLLSADSRCEDFYAKFAIFLAGLRGSVGGRADLDIPRLGVSGGVYQDSDRLDGKVSAEFADGNFSLAGASLKDVEGKLLLGFGLSDVFHWRPVTSGGSDSGHLDVGRMSYKGSGLGIGRIVFRQSAGEVLFDGNLLSEALGGDDCSISLSGKCLLPGRASDGCTGVAEAEIRVSNARFDVGIFAPKMKGMFVSGDGGGSFLFDKRSLRAGAKIAGADIEDLDKGVSVSGLNVDFDIPDLRAMRSGPEQRLSFAGLKYKDLDFGAGDIRFQMETARKIFLERSVVEWCGGVMDFGAVRVDLDDLENLDFTFFCDRMRVTDFLGQLKIAQASGEGRVAGRIPVVYRNGKLHIRNGYLYSTPGQGGKIQLKDFTGSELAATSIQMAIAREALRDYSYNWVRMNFNTLGDMMHIRLELDGAPSDRLPFAFDENTVLRPSGEGDPKARFQGISFDINFNIPMDEILRYGKKAGSMFK